MLVFSTTTIIKTPNDGLCFGGVVFTPPVEFYRPKESITWSTEIHAFVISLSSRWRRHSFSSTIFFNILLKHTMSVSKYLVLFVPPCAKSSSSYLSYHPQNNNNFTMKQNACLMKFQDASFQLHVMYIVFVNCHLVLEALTGM